MVQSARHGRTPAHAPTPEVRYFPPIKVNLGGRTIRQQLLNNKLPIFRSFFIFFIVIDHSDFLTVFTVCPW